jgi:hypothetical protein
MKNQKVTNIPILSRKQPAQDLRQFTGNTVKVILLEFPDASCIVWIWRVPNEDNDNTSRKQLQGTYLDVRNWDNLVGYIQKTYLRQS